MTAFPFIPVPWHTVGNQELNVEYVSNNEHYSVLSPNTASCETQP